MKLTHGFILYEVVYCKRYGIAPRLTERNSPVQFAVVADDLSRCHQNKAGLHKYVISASHKDRIVVLLF